MKAFAKAGLRISVFVLVAIPSIWAALAFADANARWDSAMRASLDMPSPKDALGQAAMMAQLERGEVPDPPSDGGRRTASRSDTASLASSRCVDRPRP